MPLYEYQCNACGSRFELIRKFSDPPVSECPKCGSDQVHKLISSPAFQFKGSGWYITDYARKTESSEKPAESKTEAAKAEPAKPAGETSGGGDKPAASGPATPAKDKSA